MPAPIPAPPADQAAKPHSPQAFDKLLEQAGQHYIRAPADALRLADEAIAWLGDKPAAEPLARALTVRALALAYTGAFAQALPALQQALAVLPPGPGVARARTLRAHAITYHEMGATDTSLQWAVQALDAARELGSPGVLADALLSVGTARSVNGDTAGGLHHHQEVLALYEAQGDQAGTMHALNNIGIALKNLGRHEEALVSLQRALALAQARQDAGAVTVVSSNMGEPLWRLGRTAEARTAMQDAVERAQQHGYPGAEAHGRVLLGELLAAEGDAASAQVQLEQAVAGERATGSNKNTARAHKALAALHKAAGRFERALQHHEAFHAAEQVRFNDDAQRKLRALQVQFDLARAQQEAQRARIESAELATQTRTDALTGVGNRRHLDERLADEFLRARRQGHALSVAMLDIDDFKRINDTHGHGMGDEVLRSVASLLRQHCRAIDLVTRYGGEEFCVVFLEAESAWAARACEAMRAAVEQHAWARLQPGLRVTLSIGLADRGHFDEPAALLASADAELYRAKRTGRNRVCQAPAG